MKVLSRWNEGWGVRPVAQLMRLACYGGMLLCVLNLLLCLMGRQTFTLHTGDQVYENACFAEETYGSGVLGFTAQMEDEVHIRTGSDGEIDPAIPVGLGLVYLAGTVPMLFAYWALSRVFSNVAAGQIFIEQNAACLFRFGVIECAVALLLPWLKLLLCWGISLIADGELTMSTGAGWQNALFPGAAVLVAAYILHYGVQLQDEVDHTI